MKTMPQTADAEAVEPAAPTSGADARPAVPPGRARRAARTLLPAARRIAVPAAAASATAAAAAAGAEPLVAAAAGLLGALALDRLLSARDRRAPDRRAREPAGPDPAAPAGTAAVAAPAAAPGAMSARALVDALPVPLLAISGGGRVVHANPAARASFPRLVPGGHYSGLIRAPEFVAAVEAVLAGGGGGTVAFAAAPGRERIFDARLSPLPADGGLGGEARLLVQIEDRTESRRAERLRSDFVANASHELRTPLASIIGYIETLQNHARDDADARERFLRIMEREAGRMQRLVDDLMSLSRIELSEHVRPRAPCAITDIAGEAASALLPIAGSEEVRLEIALPGTSPVVPGDRDQLYQVFSNLVDNAIKYAGRGATVRLATAPPSRAFPGCVGVSVSDDGPGIPREHLPRLTERFYRVSAGQSRTRGGTGLGLAIVKHILNRHEGRLEIVSAIGKGSTFTVWLPCGPATEPVREADRAADGAPGGAAPAEGAAADGATAAGRVS
jgi:two-component system, OmpR family, phosphate regulon sensor histidine kinase PhoR